MSLDGPLDTAMVLDIIIDTINNNEDRMHVCNRLPLVCKHTLSKNGKLKITQLVKLRLTMPL